MWIFVFLITALILTYIISTVIKPKNYPPGPRWYPFFGCNGIISRRMSKYGSQWKVISEMAKEYSTKALGLKLGSELVVVVFGEKNIRLVTTEKEFDARPDSFFLRLRSFGKRTGITFVDGPLWREHRPFMLKTFRQNGFGKQLMDDEIHEQLKVILDFLEKSNGKPISIKNCVSVALINVLWRYVADSSNETDVTSSSDLQSPEPMRRQRSSRLTEIIPGVRPKYSPLTRELRGARVESVDESDFGELQDDSFSSNGSRETVPFSLDEEFSPPTLPRVDVISRRESAINSQGLHSPHEGQENVPISPNGSFGAVPLSPNEGRADSPLPELVIEKEKIKPCDESEEFYAKLEINMKKLYRKYFICESDDDVSSNDSVVIRYKNMCRNSVSQDKESNDKELPEQMERQVSENFAKTTGEYIQEENVEQLLHFMSLRSEAFTIAGGYLNQWPWLRFILPNWTGFSIIINVNKQMADIIQDSIDKHKNKAVAGNDLIYSFLQEMYENKPLYTEDQLRGICLDILLAASNTGSSALGFAVIMLLHYPNVQQKLYEEIRNALGDKLPTWADSGRLPYTSAFICEVLRCCTIAPFAGGRRALTDFEIDGYVIPKGATVLVSLGDLHADPGIWLQPDKFIPERFIDNKGEIKAASNVYPFSIGRRRCPGEACAKSFIFIMLVGILQKYEIKCDGPLPSMEPVIGLLAEPRQFTAQFLKRA